LPLALAWPASHWVLLDANGRRGAFLEQVVGGLGLEARIEVVVDRAERTARDARWRGAFDVVVARSFGPPAVTAECATGFLRVGGTLLVSDPPKDAGERWPPESLEALGLVDRSRKGPIRVLEQARPTPDRFPRRVGAPGKRPLW
jgi:16S rRNA (guanine527-N7)-methyltransferase